MADHLKEMLTDMKSDLRLMNSQLDALVAQVLELAGKVSAFGQVVSEIKADNKESIKRFWDTHERDMKEVKSYVDDRVDSAQKDVKLWIYGIIFAFLAFAIPVGISLWKK